MKAVHAGVSVLLPEARQLTCSATLLKDLDPRILCFVPLMQLCPCFVEEVIFLMEKHLYLLLSYQVVLSRVEGDGISRSLICVLVSHVY